MLKEALAESLLLQSHYAKTLKVYKNRLRIEFPTVYSWLKTTAPVCEVK